MSNASKRGLRPIERILEALFGLIMVLTFTTTLGVAEAGKLDIRDMLIAAVGCNLAWAIIDAVTYLMTCRAERGRGLLMLRAVQETTDPQQARVLLAEALPSSIAAILEPAEYESIRQRLTRQPATAERANLHAVDWRRAGEVFLWAFLSTFPVATPFMFMHDATAALRVSNGIALAMLFALGFAYGRSAGLNPWIRGIIMVFGGVVLVMIANALGG